MSMRMLLDKVSDHNKRACKRSACHEASCSYDRIESSVSIYADRGIPSREKDETSGETG